MVPPTRCHGARQPWQQEHPQQQQRELLLARFMQRDPCTAASGTQTNKQTQHRAVGAPRCMPSRAIPRRAVLFRVVSVPLHSFLFLSFVTPFFVLRVFPSFLSPSLHTYTYTSMRPAHADVRAGFLLPRFLLSHTHHVLLGRL
ncbi:uncharacterized protein K452DRAFT_127763 [Aplosporella prunicola CBS 121167]|uniref:Transmembrane protein n=1 Tax=Aplosporella prunicola CBS 121167 TaxID=1176127 RepID=A0A6A6AXF2_9PEZI|nr:uncharacterized protein K452DRAFT_127763 [Aplosporella prunicola CBS 121167]KAF2136642.1 hypothetical protein K452DRAFT_127763 [Aplosporella prunicola CBS 121167]